MKKTILLLSTLAALSLALYGCDSKEKATTEKDIVEDAIEDVELPTTSEETTEAEDISEQTVDAERGVVENNTFTNKVFKVSFPINEDWYVCSDKEIAEIIGLTSDTIEESGSMTIEQFEAATAGTVYDCVFYFSDMQSNTNITFTSLDKLAMYATRPVEDYAELTMTQLESMSSPSYTFEDMTHETYGGCEYVCINANTDMGYQQKMLMRKENGYMVCITLTYFPELESEMQSFLDSFTEVN
ncbi:MAG: hypothetical protein E7263_03000 [Lachnospiraceae bacterium]|nr:hypothetical protein [Lachnospiraceae bacterium]